VTTTTRTVPTRVLLTGGAVAGPLFVAVVAAQVLTREGFDLSRHALSWLALGEAGAIQVAAFVVTGVLVLGLAAGARRVLHPGPAGTWGPVLLGTYGAGLVASGVFVVDPCGGFPVGSPPDCLGPMSWHFQVHNAVSMLAFAALTAACVVLARRDALLGSRGRSAFGLVVAAVVVALLGWPGYDGITLRLAAATVVMSLWTTVLALHLRATA
jgi:hypothetical membrane protein